MTDIHKKKIKNRIYDCAYRMDNITAQLFSYTFRMTSDQSLY